MNKRLLLITLILIVALPIAFGDVMFKREMPSAVEVTNTVNVSIEFKSTKQINAFDVIEFVPLGWEIEEWKVYNYDEDAVVLESLPSYQYQGKTRTAYHWSFRDGLGPSQVLLVYTLKAKEPGSQEFISVWTYPGGFDTSTSIMSVLPSEGVIFCGNEICELGETSFNCPADCPKIEVEVYDITPVLIILVIAISAALILYIYSKHLKKIMKKQATLEDLRAYLKLGLSRGYTLREMMNTLRGEGIDTKMLEELIKKDKLKKLEKGKKKVYPESEVIQKIKRIVKSMSEEDVNSIYEELGIKRIKGGEK